MQLILLLLLLATGGGDFQKFGPVLETFGGEEVKSALKEAEQLRGIMSAFGGAAAGCTASDGSEECAKAAETARPRGSSRRGISACAGIGYRQCRNNCGARALLFGCPRVTSHIATLYYNVII